MMPVRSLPPILSRALHRTDAVLPASGAYTTLDDGSYADSKAITIPPGITALTLWFTYTRSAGHAGAFAFDVRAGNGVEEVTLAPVLTPDVPSDDSPLVQASFYDVEPGWQVWVRAKETGDAAHPGKLQIAITGSTR